MIDPPLARVKEVFSAALGLSSGQVSAYLDQACGNDAETRVAVESLLAAHTRAGHFCDPADRRTPAIDAATQNLGSAHQWLLLGERPGSIIDRYTLLELIGEGGFGAVFRAEQTYPVHRQVALKVIKLGMDTAQVVARFSAERQTLALMDHPGIARVIDGGATPSGRPYFVMELVDGAPVTRFCDERRLSIRQRLELFVRICQAVQHAHQKGIIHRDLKPGNILVSEAEDAVIPKIIDFGIAKAVLPPSDSRTGMTDHRQLIGTPQYMSPEQADSEGRAADIRTDIYSLGAVLYELLTGTTPIDPASLREASIEQTRRLLRSHQPIAPSACVQISAHGGLDRFGAEVSSIQAHSRLLRGELDWIVMKAIDKDRSRRYQTVAALSEDVKRYLAGEAVLAGPPSKAYQARKFVARHQLSISIAAVVLLALAGGLAAASYGLRRAQAAQRETIEQLFDARLSQARAGSLSGRPGQRVEGLRALSEAARVHPTLAVRNQAIACLALPDIQPDRRWENESEPSASFVFDAAFTRYARSDRHGDVRIYDAATDRLLLSLAGKGQPVARIFTFSPDGHYFAATYSAPAGGLRVWELAGGKLIFEWPGPLPQQYSVDFSADGKWLAVVTGPRAISIFDTARWVEVSSIQTDGPPERIRFCPTNSNLAVSSTTRGIQIFDFRKHEVLQSIVHKPEILAIAWNDQGSLIAAADVDRHIQVWDALTGKPTATLEGHLSHPVSMQFSHGGNLLASTALDGTLRLWDPLSGRQLLMTQDLPYPQIAADDSRLATAGGSYARLWSLTVSKECRTLSGPLSDEQTGSLDFSPDGTLLAVAGQRGVRIWELTTRNCKAWIDAPAARSIFFTPDGMQLIASDPSGFRRWSLPIESDNIGASTEPAMKWGSRSIAAMSVDGKTLVYSKPDGRMWLDHEQTPIYLGRHEDTPRFIAVSPDGKWAASSRRSDRSFKIWDLSSHSLAAELRAGMEIPERGNVTFSPDGHWLVTSDPDAYSFWESGSWKLHYRLPRTLPSYFGYAAFSHDGKTLAIIGANQQITLIDPVSRIELATLTNPQPHEMQCICFSPDGRYLAVGNNDPTVTLWDLALIRRELRQMGLDWQTSK